MKVKSERFVGQNHGRNDGMFEKIAHDFLKNETDFIKREKISDEGWMVYSFEFNQIRYYPTKIIPKKWCFPLFQPFRFGFRENDEFTRKAIRAHCESVILSNVDAMKRFARGPREVTGTDLLNVLKLMPLSSRYQMLCLNSDGEIYHGTCNTVRGRDGDERYSPKVKIIRGYNEMPKENTIESCMKWGIDIVKELPKINEWIGKKFCQAFWEKPKRVDEEINDY